MSRRNIQLQFYLHDALVRLEAHTETHLIYIFNRTRSKLTIER